MNLMKVSGREMLEKMADGELSPPSMADTIYMRIEDVGEGTIVFNTRAGKEHLNPLGGVHGGFAATVLDSATGCAVHSLLEPGVGYSTVDLHIKMLRPIPKEKPLKATAHVIHISQQIGVAEASLVDEEGNLFAHGTATCAIMR